MKRRDQHRESRGPIASIVVALTIAISACSGDKAVTSPTPASASSSTGVAEFTTLNLAAPANYANPPLPAYYDAAVSVLDNAPAGDFISDRIATLGRALFHDKRLSVNNTVSCASCHQQPQGFEDPNRFSAGFSGGLFTTAHAMRLGNVRYFRPGSMFWDRRAGSIEAQASQPITNPVEMGFDATAGGFAALITRMAASAYYPALFTFAFGDATITEGRVQQALAQFERSMISSNSRWDSAYAQVFSPTAPNRNLNAPLPGFSPEEDRGRQLFMTGPGGGGGCSACHVPPTFALNANSNSNGLDPGETIVFKSPSLKNVGLSRAFMHDGRFSSLDQVVEHYNSGVQAGPALDNRLRVPGGAPLRLNLSPADKSALVAFMQTLTDNAITTDPRFSDPFRK